MKISRDWATPLTIGSFVLMAVTGVLMFFHLDSGLNKLAHEWLGWVMVAGVAFHIVANWMAFKRHLTVSRSGQVIAGVGVLVLAASFLPLGGGEGGGASPPVLAMRGVLGAPLAQVQPLTGQSLEALQARLQAAGFKVDDVQKQPLQAVVGADRERTGALLRVLFSAPAGAAAGAAAKGG